MRTNRSERYAHCVQRLADGRWVVAWRDRRAGAYLAPMTAEERRLTGCRAWTARDVNNLGGGYIYTRRSDALRRAEQIFSMRG